MRIGIDIRCLTEKYYSGISEYTYNLLNELLKIDQQNQYFLFYNASRSVTLPKFDYPNVEYKKYNYPNKIFNLSMTFLKYPAIDRLIGGVDVFLTPGFLFSHLSKKCRKILIIHDLSFEIYPDFFTFKKRLWHKLIRPKLLCQKADWLIAVSQNTKNDLVNLYQINPKKIKVISQGLNSLFSQPDDENQLLTVKNKYQLSNNYIFYLGNLEPRKNLSSLIKAYELIKSDVDLVIAGSPAWKYKNIYRLYERSNKKEKIKFLGYIPLQDKKSLYLMAKIFVYPSIYEGFGLQVLEAMACGKPVITSFNSSLVEVIGDAGLLIDPYNINELAKSIDELLADEKLQQILSERGLEQAKKFSWPATAAEILKIIELGIKN